VSRPPDFAAACVGWRVWDVVALDGGHRLCSLNFWTIWLPRRETVAVCRRALVELDRAGVPGHDAPALRCTCGLYATRTAADVLAYASQFPLRRDALHRVVGRVRLWGTVVEADAGWRAERAYPAALFVPTGQGGRIPRPGRLPRPRVPLAGLADGLAAYGVPVEVVDAGTEGELARRLERPEPGP
jgi:hypothetical protein